MQQTTTDAQAVKKAPAKRRTAKKESKTKVVKAKRKRSIARGYIKAGKGSLRINGKQVSAIETDAIKNMIMEPLLISSQAREWAKKMDININVKGGGVSSQMQAVRGAIAKGIVAFSGSESLKKEFLQYDRSIIVDDARRVEPKKFLGTKARAKFQTSYR